MVEGVVAIPFFLLLFAGIIFVGKMYETKMIPNNQPSSDRSRSSSPCFFHAISSDSCARSSASTCVAPNRTRWRITFSTWVGANTC